ncbi:hypothetical protein Pmar_PMAR026229 [Perkinsus marinus ATCC 50983]|uniref:Uncharacterized protein n=1 Tax=Perkinsus marinus (strain ATCC 50983 / TXsc) TaxID=423536 RepID=C5KSD1_PERM5|nr:hypothetical protein Pmar_PMAR026229 [Perkinsus marinus ATCC 50983]EER12621.1 hypothetical protein Pmar_PMAR026229 [Perkinsus marinus ATCC 50983]|eukprot:XP_002780826.1 hypothetical protein Pmar_PMAR026229 [Perkinsus marinus ATCC 50983]
MDMEVQPSSIERPYYKHFALLKAHKAGKLLLVSFELTVMLLVLNMVDTMAVVALYDEVYKGIRGLVEEVTDDLDSFRFVQTLLRIVMVCFATVPCGSIESFFSNAMLDRQT